MVKLLQAERAELSKYGPSFCIFINKHKIVKTGPVEIKVYVSISVKYMSAKK